MADSLRDIWLAGTCWGELVWNQAELDIVKIKPLNPDPNIIDFIRKGATDRVELDEEGEPKGFERKELGYKKIVWTRDEITRAGKAIWERGTSEYKDGRDRVYYMKLWSMSESYLGYTPLVSVYKDELIRLNLADAAGESAFQGTGVIAYVTEPEEQTIPTEQLDKLETDLRKVRSKTIFVFPDKIKIARFPSPDLRELASHRTISTDDVCTGLGIKRELLQTPGIRGSGADIGASELDFEERISILQGIYADEVNDNIIRKRAKLLTKKRDPVPGVDYPLWTFKSLERAVKLSEARRRAVYAKSGLLTYDTKLEERIRTEEGLPCEGLSQERPVQAKEDLYSMVKRAVEEVLEEQKNG